MKALALMVYGVAAFAAGVWSRNPEKVSTWAVAGFLVAVAFGVIAWRL